MNKDLSIKELLNKLAPEYFTLRLYHAFTYVRVVLFYILLVLYLLNALWGDVWANIPWTQDDLVFVASRGIYILLAVGALTATWFAIVIEIIKKSNRAAGQWANIVKYVVYPVITAVIISYVPLLHKFGIIIPAPLSLSLLIAYLIFNSLFTTVKEAENIANGVYGTEDES